MSGSLLVALLGGCPAETSTHGTEDPVTPEEDAGVNPCATSAGTVLCGAGQVATTCAADGTVASTRDCAAESMMCTPAIGCTTCIPRRGSCDGNVPIRCRDDGTAFDRSEPCDVEAGLTCNAGTGLCANLCEEAAASKSYIGCEYWPVTTLNSGIAAEFEFAVVVANPQVVPATVYVTRSEAAVGSPTVVPPGSLATIKLPWVDALRGQYAEERSALVPGGAYRLRSSVPVTVYQFNPLDYRIARDCASEFETGQDPYDGQCFSYSNDASLLLPSNVLTGNYTVLSRPSMTQEVPAGWSGETALSSSPGFFTVVGADTAAVDVTIDFTAHVWASADGAISAYGPGAEGTFTLNPGDVLQLTTAAPETCTGGTTDSLGFAGEIHYCEVGADYDFTGTRIHATGKVEVIAGHNCDFVPYNRWACDHLEEAMFPEESLGKELVVSVTRPLRSEPNVVKIVSVDDGNSISFDPSSVAGARTLNRGESMEFEARTDFRVTGSGALLVGQFLVGQDYEGIGASGEEGQGDPSMSLAIPTEQFRRTYAFLAPESYASSFVNVTASVGQAVELDASPVTGWTAIGASGLVSARIPIAGGAHTIESAEPFGIVVYGFGAFTSYMVPGGLDLEEINPLR